MAQLHYALDDYYLEYLSLPLANNHNGDEILLTTGDGTETLMMILVGANSRDSESTKHLTFFDYKRTLSGRDRDGLLRTKDSAELFDPWGNPYHVLLDYDSDGKLKDPHTGKIIEGHRALTWSPGPDKISGTKDDICSWK